MIIFFRSSSATCYAAELARDLSTKEMELLCNLLSASSRQAESSLAGQYLGPRKGMVSPWSTNATDIAHAIGLEAVLRIEPLTPQVSATAPYDPMLQQVYDHPGQDVFYLPPPTQRYTPIADLAAYNACEGLGLNAEEIDYLHGIAAARGRPLTDAEAFGFSQLNSEHCRHKIFNGSIVIDGHTMPRSLFDWIRVSTRKHPNHVVSAYRDNVAFIDGPEIEWFSPARGDAPSAFSIWRAASILSLKAETHNFPVTVEPFSGAATGAGGEIRDRLAGGKGSIPLAGTAVYMTSYPRLGQRTAPWPARAWRYQSPADILIKASDGASDFGNKFGQPLICGSLLTFEHMENGRAYGFDKAVMLAGGVGVAKRQDSKKVALRSGDKVVALGGDNYRIGIGGGAVSSEATGALGARVEYNAIQRANPEMQRRVMNVIRALVEMKRNPVRSIHDHGAGGHFNCFAELLNPWGGVINIDQLPLGDASLSYTELLCNESQERMGLALAPKDIAAVQRIAERERAPLYVVGTVAADGRFRCRDAQRGETPVDLKMSELLGSPPTAVLADRRERLSFSPIAYRPAAWASYLDTVLRLESVACKDWLTNKVDRSVTGKVAKQQTCGAVQLPLNNVGVMALDFSGRAGVATSLGHASGVALIDPAAASRLAIARALTNIVWAPLRYGLQGASLSANWMWAARQPGQGTALYDAVAAASLFAQALRINIPTGKDSLSMTQRYPNGEAVNAPGAVVISAAAEVANVNGVVSPCLMGEAGSKLIYIYFCSGRFELGGGALAQSMSKVGDTTPDADDAGAFAASFAAVQALIRENWVLAGHDVAAGGLIVTLLEMCFPSPGWGMRVDVRALGDDAVKVLFGEAPGVVVQTREVEKVTALLQRHKARFAVLGSVIRGRTLTVQSAAGKETLAIDEKRAIWFETSFLLDSLQRSRAYAAQRQARYGEQPLKYVFPTHFSGRLSAYTGKARHMTPVAAVVREKGVNGDRELAYGLYLAGFTVKDVHTTDLISGRETLDGVSLIAFAGGFSHSDVLRSAKGWAASLLHNAQAKAALDRFYAREDTLSIGVCNGCQLMMELGLIGAGTRRRPAIGKNASRKFESAFVNITVARTNSIMLGALAGARLGVWVAHGEGRFRLPGQGLSSYQVAATYSYAEYPGNPNGSDQNAAALVSANGRHLAIMPHIERSLFPWNWAYYPPGRTQDQVSPWIEAFAHAYVWARKQLPAKKKVSPAKQIGRA